MAAINATSAAPTGGGSKGSSSIANPVQPRIGDKYVLVLADEKSSVCSNESGTSGDDNPLVTKLSLSSVSSLTRLKGLHRVRSRVKGAGGLSGYDITLAFENSSNATGGTANNAVIPVDPTQSAEWPSIQSLFDEIKVEGGSFKFFVNSTGGTPLGNHGSMAYDPTDLSTYSNDLEPLVASQHFGPFTIQPSGDAATTANILWGPQSRNSLGVWDFKFKCPKAGFQRQAGTSSTQTSISTGSWGSTQSPGVFGFIKPYIPGGGTGVTTSINYWFLLHCRVRSRT